MCSKRGIACILIRTIGRIRPGTPPPSLTAPFTAVDRLRSLSKKGTGYISIPYTSSRASNAHTMISTNRLPLRAYKANSRVGGPRLIIAPK